MIPRALFQPCAERWLKIDLNKPAGEIRTVGAYLDRQIQYIRLYILLLGIFGGIAAILAAIGI